MEARSDIDAQIVRYTRFLEAKDKSNHLVADFLKVFFSLKLELNSSHLVKRMVEGIGGHALFDLFSNFKWVGSNDFFGELLCGMRELCVGHTKPKHTHQTHTTNTNNTTPQTTPQTPHALPHTTQHNTTSHGERRQKKRTEKERQREDK